MITIDQVLNDKGREVATILSTSTLHEVSRILDTSKIGAVVSLTPDGKICGVLSERDIVRQVATVGAEALSMTV